MESNNRFYDVHCHILPNVDDGPTTPEEAVKLVALQIADGIAAAAATSHFNPDADDLGRFAAVRQNGAEQLKSALRLKKANFQICLGAEVVFHPALLGYPDLSPLCYEGTQFLLLEIHDSVWPVWGDDLLYRLRLRGILPIFAHVERYRCFRRHPEKLAALEKEGVYAQLNAGSVLPSSEMRPFAKEMIRRGMIHFIGTDCHSADKRPPNAAEAYARIRRDFGEFTEEQFRANAEGLFAGRVPLTSMPAPVRRSFWHLFRPAR